MKKEHKETVAQILFKDKQILTARPEDMPFEEYKLLRYTQSLVLKRMFRECPSRKLMGIIPCAPIYNRKRHRINAVENTERAEDTAVGY